jgi:hypothetical protein
MEHDSTALKPGSMAAQALPPSLLLSPPLTTSSMAKQQCCQRQAAHREVPDQRDRQHGHVHVVLQVREQLADAVHSTLQSGSICCLHLKVAPGRLHWYGL